MSRAILTDDLTEAPAAASGRSAPSGTDNAAIWFVCHYPETGEADERAAAVRALHESLGLPIWLFGTCLARYERSVEVMLKEKLVQLGIRPQAIFCSGDLEGIGDCLDTIQEARKVVGVARQTGLTLLFCVSNSLQLLQVYFLVRKEPIRIVYVPTRLRDWRLWYLGARIALIPMAILGIRDDSLVFRLLRRARASLRRWPF